MKPFQPIPVLLAETDAPAAETQPLKQVGAIYSMAQAVRWLDANRFAVGRWDGSLTIFRCAEQAGMPPKICAALVAPSFAGVEMIARVKPRIFASSNDSKSIIVWQAEDNDFDDIELLGQLTYDEACGVANDGTTTEVDGALYFVSGHANGFLLVWVVEGEDAESIKLVHKLDMRSPDPIPNPFPGYPQLMNIRGVERWQPGFVVTGSEDGDMCLVDVRQGKTVARMRYNATAQRGINDIDTCGDYVLLANCSVGKDDKNTWLYRISEKGFELVDAANYKVDEAREQVFNFCVDQAVVDKKQYFFAATQEGVAWVGLVEETGLRLLGSKAVSTNFGAALAYENDTHLLAVAGDNIHLFQLEQNLAQ